MAKKTGELPTSRLSMIAESTILEGTLQAEGDVKISGRIVGNVEATSRVMIASSGVVEGGIQAAAATIAGGIYGDIEVVERLMLISSAHVEGAIEAGKLVIEDGAVFNGSCRIVEGKEAPRGAESNKPPALVRPSALERKRARKRERAPKKKARSKPSTVKQPDPSTVTKKAVGREGGIRRSVLAILGIFVVTVLATGAYYGFTSTTNEAGSLLDPPDDQSVEQSEALAEAPSVAVEDPNNGAVVPISDAPAEALPDAPIIEDPVRQTAGLDRIAMEEARQRVLDRSTEAGVVLLYQQAKAERVVGLDHADSGNFEQASQSFRAARALFMQMQQALGEQDAALAQAALVDTATVIATVTEAETIPEEIPDTPEETLTDGTTDEPLDTAEATPPDAEEVETSVDAVEEVPAETTSEDEAAALAEVQEVVRSLTRELKLTIEREDAASMNALYYRGWESFFEEAEAITAVVRSGDVQISGTEATASVSLDLSYRDADNQNQQRAQANVWTLMQLGEEWVLRRVSSR